MLLPQMWLRWCGVRIALNTTDIDIATITQTPLRITIFAVTESERKKTMSKCTEIREICGDYAFDVEYSKDFSFTMFFNSLRNAQTVKRCIEVDDSVPNVATAVDFVEVVRCKDCKHATFYSCGNDVCSGTDDENFFCSYGERKDKR
jgi:hypothetical protein